jgi:hypothetical protein
MRFRSRLQRRGTAYVLVLSIAVLVTVLGMGALTLTRVSAVSTAAGSDWEEAGDLAFSATEQGMAAINAAAAASPTGWRSAYTSRQTVATTPMGRGTMSWAIKDETDGNLSEDYLRPVRIYGIGQVGSVTRIYSVQAMPGGSPLDLLRTAVHASGAISVTGNLNAVNGPLSSNSSVSLSGTMNGSIEAASTSGTAAGTQTITTPAAVKTMPLSTVFTDLSANATVIDYSSLSGGQIKNSLLSSTSNPFGTPDPNGLYAIAMPSSKTLTITSCRIVGTLLINAGNKGQVNIQGPIEWEHGPLNYPILVITGTSLGVTFSGSPTWLSESQSAVNFNPAGTPYQGTSNSTTTDDYPPVLHGVIHVIGDSGSSVKLNANTYIFGTLICGATCQTTAQTTLIQDPNIYASPPVGYSTGNALFEVGGSWRWDTLP